MKLFVFAAVASLAIFRASASVATIGSPVERIVNLLKSLKATTEGDAKVEAQIYDKYACWCEKTATRKAQHIVTADAELRALGQRILKLKGKIATRTAEIAELTENIKSNEDEQEELTAVRSKQNAAWMGESAETKQALAALQDAIKVLAGATTPKAGSALLQGTLHMRCTSAVKTALDALPSKAVVPEAKLALLDEFTKAKAGYAPQSATIQGMLADMYLTFANDLESSTLEEATRNGDFEKMYADLEKENNQLKETRDKKEKEKAEAEAMLADTTKAYDDTEKQMKADTKFFDQVKAGCESKHEEWTLREKLRTEELSGIDKALEILTGDAARELFAKSIKPGVETFLQVASTPTLLQNAANAPVAKAYNALRAQVRKSHSIRLAALAVKIRTTKVGHFDKVIKAIDDMVKTLQDEGAADIAKKDQCLEEYQKNTKTVSDLEWKIKNNEAKIAKLEKLIELRTQEKEDTQEKIKETNKYIKDLTDERKEEHDAFLKAKKDDEDAIDLLSKAKAAFADFYKKNAAAAAVLLLEEEPVFERSKDDAPDATFSDKGKNKLKGKGIISLFNYIIEDLNDEVANSRKAEATSQAEFEEEKATAEKLLEDLKEKVVTLEGIIAKRNEAKKDENKLMKNNNVDRDAELAYKAKIKPDCDWIIGAFDKRAEARSAEMNGLTAAKEFLAGQSALLEKSKKQFDDSRLSNIGFLGVA